MSVLLWENRRILIQVNIALTIISRNHFLPLNVEHNVFSLNYSLVIVFYGRFQCLIQKKNSFPCNFLQINPRKPSRLALGRPTIGVRLTNRIVCFVWRAFAFARLLLFLNLNRTKRTSFDSKTVIVFRTSDLAS